VAKQQLYKEFLGRIETAIAEEQHLQASWYAYAVLEDRLRSLLRPSGGEGKSRGVGAPIKMLGPKLKELNRRAAADKLLDDYFQYARLEQWKHDRNNLTHAMAGGNLPIEQIDEKARALATEGAALAKVYAASARRLKKNRDKVPAPPL